MRTFLIIALWLATHALAHAMADGGAEITDPYFAKQKALQYMHLDQALPILLDEKTRAQTPILVGVIDEGQINAHHPDMLDVVLPESDTTTHSWDTSHGQYVAGILAAESNNGVGISGAIGTHVRLIYHSVRTIDDIVAAINKMAARGVAVVNMSLGVEQRCNSVNNDGKCQVPIATNTAVAAAIEKAMHDANMTFVISAGNDGMKLPRLAPMNDGLIVVGAMDENNQRSSSSNFGEGVSVFAPNFGVWGLTFDSYGLEAPATSFTTPLVTGAAAWAALYLTAHGIKYTPKDVKSIILKSIQPQSKLSGFAEAAGSLDYLALAHRLQTFVTARLTASVTVSKLLNKAGRKTE